MINLQCFWKIAAVLNFKWEMCLYSKKEDKYVSGGIHDTGAWEKDMVVFMLKTMQEYPNSTLLDIGGNIGYYTLAAASAGFHVNVFEPVPANAAMIQQSISKNRFENIKLHTTALGSNVKEIGMGLSKSNQGGVRHDSRTKSFTILPSMVLDELLAPEGRPVYIKIDIEGGECDAIKGMKKYISSSENIIGVNMEFGQSRTNCCSQWVQPEGFFDVLYRKHKLCPMNIQYDQNICLSKAWDLVWRKCEKSSSVIK